MIEIEGFYIISKNICPEDDTYVHWILNGTFVFANNKELEIFKNNLTEVFRLYTINDYGENDNGYIVITKEEMKKIKKTFFERGII